MVFKLSYVVDLDVELQHQCRKYARTKILAVVALQVHYSSFSAGYVVGHELKLSMSPC